MKQPILYTSVATRNWQAWKKIGIGAVYSPGSYHVHTKLDFPVNLGSYSYSGGPDEPVVVHMERYPRMTARKPFGRVTIANADAGSLAMFECAVEQAHRAVAELRKG